MDYSLMWNGQPSGLTFEPTLDQNEQGEAIELGEVELVEKMKQRGEMEKPEWRRSREKAWLAGMRRLRLTPEADG